MNSNCEGKFTGREWSGVVEKGVGSRHFSSVNWGNFVSQTEQQHEREKTTLNSSQKRIRKNRRKKNKKINSRERENKWFKWIIIYTSIIIIISSLGTSKTFCWFCSLAQVLFLFLAFVLFTRMYARGSRMLWIFGDDSESCWSDNEGSHSRKPSMLKISARQKTKHFLKTTFFSTAERKLKLRWVTKCSFDSSYCRPATAVFLQHSSSFFRLLLAIDFASTQQNSKSKTWTEEKKNAWLDSCWCCRCPCFCCFLCSIWA